MVYSYVIVIYLYLYLRQFIFLKQNFMNFYYIICMKVRSFFLCIVLIFLLVKKNNHFPIKRVLVKNIEIREDKCHKLVFAHVQYLVLYKLYHTIYLFIVYEMTRLCVFKKMFSDKKYITPIN